MKLLFAYLMLLISILMALYWILVNPEIYTIWYGLIMMGLTTFGGILHGLARRQKQ